MRRSWHVNGLEIWHRIEHHIHAIPGTALVVGDPALVAKKLKQCDAELAGKHSNSHSLNLTLSMSRQLAGPQKPKVLVAISDFYEGALSVFFDGRPGHHCLRRITDQGPEQTGIAIYPGAGDLSRGHPTLFEKSFLLRVKRESRPGTKIKLWLQRSLNLKYCQQLAHSRISSVLMKAG